MGVFDWLFGKKKLSANQPAEAVVAPAQPTEADILDALNRVEELVATGVPTAVSSRVYRVTRSIRQTLPRIGNLGFGSYDSFSLMATATDYLPEALGTYLRLPRDWADSRPIENGKTALMLLIDQLDLLGATMEKIFDAVSMADATALITHGRFLQQKFGSDHSELQLPLSSTSAPANPLELE